MGTIQHTTPVTQPVGKKPPRFKGALPLSPLAQMFYFFETKYEPGFILVSKVIGNAAPRIAITRTKDEFGEVLFNEGTQTAGFFAVLPLGSAVLNPITSALTGVSTKLIKMRNEEAFKKVSGMALQKLKVAKVAKSLGVLSFIFFLKIAMPYIRNYRTIKVTGFSDYSKVVALGGKASKPTAEDKKIADKAAQYNRNVILGLLAAGGVAALGILGYAGALCKGGAGKKMLTKGLLNPKNLDFLTSRFALVGKNSNQVMSLTKSKIQTFWFWGFPSYVGWFMGCRDKYEIVEQVSKFGTFILGYMYMTPLMANIFKRLDKPLLKQVEKATGRTILPKYINVPSYKEIIQDKLIKDRGLAKSFLGHLDRRNGWALIANLFVVGALPIVFNIWFSNWRYQRDHANDNKAAAPPTVSKPFTLPPLPATAPIERPKPAKPYLPEEPPTYQQPSTSWIDSRYSNPYYSQIYSAQPATPWSDWSQGYQQPTYQQPAYGYW